MSETNMPAAEAAVRNDEQEIASYELAYHILPTVAEGEVMTVENELKALITKAGGEVFDTEAAERFELAYEIDKYLEGRYRKFNSAYFGWTRFKLAPAALTELTSHVDEHKQLLRFLLVRLTKVEEANPFKFHEALVDTKIKNIDLDVELAADAEVVDTDDIIDEVVEEEVKVA
ncbi:30S ribosomal protein S6 [Patescibacteria group bacterium]|nr:30S ribosomal protein S6 [Patescibacteria group bacterium]